jgi:AcrR family transcriptional regulator
MEEMSTDKATTRLTKEEWLRGALNVLAREGGARLHIDNLCRKMKVTKGSFYWHFRNRDDFITHLLDYYLRFTNRSVFDAVGHMMDDPRSCLRTTLEIVQTKQLGRYEVLMRSWAAHDRRIARVIREGERQRMKFVKGLFRQLGFRGAELEDRTRLFVVYQRGENVSYIREPAKGRRERIRRRVALLTSR